MRPVAALFVAVMLAGCPRDDPTTPTDNTGGSTTDTLDFDCPYFCEQGVQDIVDAGCTAVSPLTPDELDDCVANCEYSLAVPTCGELFATFWQCTLDEYPGKITCDAYGNPNQPPDCDAEQQAVLDCMG